ncbi:protein of unknown function [Pseudodesulfovibrio profundus]|uniref:Uncharacterized protein n=1 Tax=Pseudodesulfovibrio profundus TaxID=57320 RepID=A0A2C8FBE9_9BACT|nr:protein of unknown function [Pseudodesulfovibrio profundus]
MTTPGSFSISDSTHQKHPPAMVAISRLFVSIMTLSLSVACPRKTSPISNVISPMAGTIKRFRDMMLSFIAKNNFYYLYKIGLHWVCVKAIHN